MNIKELFTNDVGKMSHTKTWSNVAYATMTFIVIFMAIKGTLLLDMFIAYGMIVAIHNSTSKFISAKFASGSVLSTTGTETPENIETKK